MDSEWAALAESWDLSLEVDGYSAATRRSYGKALASVAAHVGDTAPGDVTRAQVRGWLAHVTRSASPSTARTWLAGVRHFFRFALAEEEIGTDPTAGIRGPNPGDPVTDVLSVEQLRALLATCGGKSYTARRDAAIIRLFADGGLRLAELAGLSVADVDLRERMVYVHGKGSRRSGPRHRAVPVGVKTMQALDRYLRERRQHPWATADALWLGDRGRGPVTTDAIKRILQRRAATAGIKGLHPHMMRHTWADQFRKAGGSEGDLMVLGGWRNRQMLDRYGKAAAAGRAADAYRRLSLGDRL
ncbi:MAG TPA: tyrosine-type recombinase/integrase [Dehalococcoidia bacterium]|jgi:site-specific recombinase XerD